MTRYETLILAVPEITKDETASLEKHVSKEIKEYKGNLVSFDRWGKYKLAYPVRKNDYGVYFLARFDAQEEGVQKLIEDLRKMFVLKFENIVMRQMTSCVKATDEVYNKPDSLEDVPSRDVDSFIRENKMEGILSSSKEAPKPEAKEVVVETVTEEVEA